MSRNSTIPVTVNQALDIARIILTNARDLRLNIVASNSYTDEADKLRLLARLGGISATYYELCDFVWAVDELRRGLLRTKPEPPSCQAVLTELDKKVFILSEVTHEKVATLPELAVEGEQLRASVQRTTDKRKNNRRYQLTDWRPLTPAEQVAQIESILGRVATASVMIGRLSAQLARVSEVAEASTVSSFRTASTWLK